MKKKEFDRKQKESKKLIDFISCFERRSSVSLEGSFADKVNGSIKAVESVWAEVNQLEKALEDKQKELSAQMKLYNSIIKDAEKVKKRVDPKIKAEIKEELKKLDKDTAGSVASPVEDAPIPVPTAQTKKKEELVEQEAVLQEVEHKHKKTKK